MIPRRDLHLPDKRRLRYKGLHQLPLGHAHLWRHPEGLSVQADELDGTLHVSISHRERDPTDTEIDAVEALFFTDIAAERTCPTAAVSDDDFRLGAIAAGMPGLRRHRFKIWHLLERQAAN